MIFRNNSITEDEIFQNQFTAYVTLAIRHRRIDYIRKLERKNGKELSLSEVEDFLPDEDDQVEKVLEYEMLRRAMCQIRDKERKIVLARVVEEKPFTEIAQEMGMTYKAVTHLYYRVLKRLKVHMEGVDNG